MLGDTVRQARIHKNLTQARLARLAGVSRRHLAALEKGANVSVAVVRKVATVLELTEIPLGNLSLLPAGGDQPMLNVPLLTDAIREARADALRAQEILARAEDLLGRGSHAAAAETTFPAMPPHRVDVRPATASAGMLRERAGVQSVRIAGAIAQGAPIDDSASEPVELPANLIDEGEIVLRARGDSLRDHGIEDGDLLIVELRPRGRAATGELAIVRIGANVHIGRWWQKHGRKALLTNALAEVTVGSSPRSLKVMGVVNAVVRPSEG